MLLLLLIAPYWVNEILRAFAFRILFSTSGVINNALLSLHLLCAPVDLIGNDIALYAGLSYAYILMMVFSLYNAIESLAHNQIEAARDLGAPWWHIHLFVVMPFAKARYRFGLHPCVHAHRGCTCRPAGAWRASYPLVYVNRL